MPILTAPVAEPKLPVIQVAEGKTAQVIGKVAQVQGEAWIIRDGQKIAAAKDAPLLKGDEVETAPAAEISLVFADRSTFVLKDRGLIGLDEFTYDPASKTGSESILVAQGAFSFVSGDIAKSHPGAARLATPAMSIGVRGTTVVGSVGSGGETSVALQPDPGSSFVGEISLTRPGSGDAPLVISDAGAGVLGATLGSSFTPSNNAGAVVGAIAPAPSTPPTSAPNLPSSAPAGGGDAGGGQGANGSGNGGGDVGGNGGTGNGGGDGGGDGGGGGGNEGGGDEGRVDVPPVPPVPVDAIGTVSGGGETGVGGGGDGTGGGGTAGGTLGGGNTNTGNTNTSGSSTQTNAAPVASGTALAAAGTEETSYTITAADLLALVSDPDGDVLTLTGAVTADHGSITDNLDGTYTLAPDPDFHGTMTISYGVSDGTTSITATTTASFANTPDAPVAGSVTLPTGSEDTGLVLTLAQLLGSATDPDGDVLSITNLSASNGASFTDNGNGTFTITPAANYNGSVSLTYDISDGTGNLVGTSATVTVNAVNDAPTMSTSVGMSAASEDGPFPGETVFALFSTGFTDTADLGTLAGVAVIGNNTVSPDGAWQYSSDGGTTWVDVGGVNDNTFALALSASTKLRFNAAPDFHGTAPSLHVRGLDNTYAGGWSSSTGSAVYTNTSSPGGSSAISAGATELSTAVNAVNDAPTTSAVTLTAGVENVLYTFTATQLLANAVDVDGDALTISSITPSTGTVNNLGSGNYSWTLPADYNGSASLAYVISDGQTGTVAGTANLSIAAMVTTAGIDTLTAGDGDNSYRVPAGTFASGDSIIDTGIVGDVDTLRVTSAGTIDLAAGSVSGIEVIQVETTGNTTLRLGGGANPQQFTSIIGNTGMDVIAMADADSTLDLTGITLTAIDSVTTGTGSDTLVLDETSAAGANVFVDGQTGDGDVVKFFQSTAGSLDISGKTFVNIESTVMEALDPTGATLTGHAQGTTFIGGTGNDALNGGAGQDKAVFDGLVNEYSLSGDGSGNLVVDHGPGIDGTDTLSGIETLAFSGSTLDVGHDVQINVTTGNEQKGAEVATLSDGGYVIVWQSNLQDGDSWGVYGQVHNADGSIRVAEFRLSDYTAGEQMDLSVAGDASGGGFMVTWTQWAGQDGNYGGIFARHFDGGGVAGTAGDLQINTTWMGDQNASNVTALAGGNYLFTYMVDDANYSGVNFRIVDASGAQVVGETLVNQYSTQHQTLSASAQLTNGNIIIVWQSDTQDGDTSRAVVGRMMDSSGNFLGNEFVIPTITSGVQGNPSVSALGTGFVVVWASEGVDAGYAVCGQRYDSAGAAQGGQFTVNVTTAGDQAAPQVTQLSGGGFVVTWQCSTTDGSGNAVIARMFDASGTPTSAEITVNDHKALDQGNPSVTALSGGGFLVTWESNGQDGSANGIYSRRFDATGVPESPLVLTATASADQVSVGSNIDQVILGDGNDQLAASNAALSGGMVVQGGSGADSVMVLDNASLTGANLSGLLSVETLVLGDISGVAQTVALGTQVQTQSIGTVDASLAAGDVSVNAALRTSAVTITTAVGNDSVTGGAGADVINTGAGNDTVFSSAGNDIVNGGTGTNTLDYGADAAAITVNLGAGTVIDGYGATDSVSNISKVIGSAYADTFQGSTQSETFTGGGGADVFVYTDSSQSLDVMANRDTITDFTSGTDHLRISLSGAHVDVSGFESVASYNGGQASLTGGFARTGGVIGDGFYSSGDQAFYIYVGDTTSDIGADGGYVISSANAIAATDLDFNISGTAGTDTLVGGAGSDTLTASAGADSLTGNGGADTFVLADNTNTTITDFTVGTDTVTLSHAEFGLGSSGTLAASDYAESSTAMSGAAVNYGATGDGLVAIQNGADVQLWSTTAMEAATTANSVLVGTLNNVNTSALDNTSFHLAV